MSTVAQLMVKIGADITDLQRGMSQANSSISGLASSVGGKLNSIGEGFTNIGKKATMMTAPIAIGMGVAIKTAADFESQMNILTITMRDSGVAAEQWSQAALKIGADADLVGISASEAANAITNFGKAGLDTNQILGDMQGYLAGTADLSGALRAAIDLAAASELDLDAASMAVVQTMNQYGLTFDQASSVMDNFVRTADASTASVEDLVAAQQNVAPVMAQLGFSVQDANIMLAELADRGIAGAEAGTALKSMFLNMTNPATKAGKALGALNVSLYDATGTMRSAEDIVKDLSAALDEQATVTYTLGGATKDQSKELVSYEKKIKAAQVAIEEYNAGVRGATMSEKTRAAKIAELNTKIAFYTQKHQELAGTIPGVTTATMQMNDAMRNNYLQMIAGAYGIKALNILLDEGAIGWDDYEKAVAGATSMQEQAAARTEGFQAAMEQFKSVLETFMITAATPFIKEFLTPFLRKAGDFLQKLMEVHPQFAKWAFVIGGVLVVAGPLLMVIGGMISAIGTIISAVGAVVGVFGALAGAIGGVIAAIAAVAGPVLAVIAIIAAAVLAFKLAWENNWLGIRDALQPFVDAVGRAWDSIKAIFTAFGAFLRGDISWSQFLDIAKAKLEEAKNWILEAFRRLGDGIAQIWENIKAMLVQKLIEFIAPLVGGVENAREIVTTAFERIGFFLTHFWDGVKNTFIIAWELIKGIVSGAIEFIRGILAVVMQIISGDWEGAWETIKQTVVNVWDGIKSGIQGALDVIAPKITEAWETIKTNVSNAVETLKTNVAQKWDQIKSGAVEKWEAVRERITSIVTAIKDFVVNTIGGLVEKAIELFGNLISAITGGGGSGGVGGGSPFSFDFTELIGQLMVLREAWTLTSDHIVTTLTTILTNVTTTWTAIQLFLTTTWTLLQTEFTTWTATMLQLTVLHHQLVLDNYTVSWDTIKLMLFGVWQQIADEYVRQLLIMLAQTRQVNQWILQDFQRVWPRIKAAAVDNAIQMRDEVVAAFNDMKAKVEAILSSMESAASAAGKALGEAFAAGIRASIPAIAAAAAAAAAAARQYLPGSDAKVGPLSDLTASGRALPETLAKGMRLGIMDVVSAANYLAGQMMPAHPTRPFELAAENFFGGASALSGNHPTRPFEVAPAGSFGGAPQGNQPGGQCITINIYNPTGRPSEESIMLALKKLAAVGVLNPV